MSSVDINKLTNNIFENLSLFEMSRLRAAIDKEIENPERIKQVKSQIKIGQDILYFEYQENRLVEATILQIKQSRVIVQNKSNNKKWSVAISDLNIDNIDASLNFNNKKLSKNELRVGDHVGFINKEGIEIFGVVTKLNPKTASVKTDTTMWRVSYGLLFKVIQGSQSFAHLQAQLKTTT